MPPGFTGSAVAYDEPKFTDSRNGVLPATLTDGVDSAVALFTSADGGASWKAAGVRRLPEPLEHGVAAPAAVVSTDDWVVGAPAGGRLFATGDRGRSWRTVAPNGLPSGVAQLDFASPAVGWALIASGRCTGYKSGCTVTHEARRTTDGGQTWEVVTE
jgi:photosystem II stability/assembly factor-like uncharacterized protein